MSEAQAPDAEGQRQPPSSKPHGLNMAFEAFESGTAYPESDADDEYERSLHDSSPVLATDDEASPSSEGFSSNDHTPTFMTSHNSGDRLPETIITEWTADECADFVGSLGLQQYGDQFLGRRPGLEDQSEAYTYTG